jgi:hypothetical protein
MEDRLDNIEGDPGFQMDDGRIQCRHQSWPPPNRDREAILEKLQALEYFPHIYPCERRGRRFRRRRFHAANSLFYYGAVGSTAYIRSLWPAQIP